MSEFLVVSSTFARQPLLAIVAGVRARWWHSARCCCASGHCLRRAARRRRAGAGLLRADRSRISRWCWSRASICRRRWSPGSSTSRGCSDSAMAAVLDDMLAGRRSTGHRPWPRPWSTAALARRCATLAAGRPTLLGLWGDAGVRAHGASGRGAATSPSLSLACPEGVSLRRRASIRPRSGWSARRGIFRPRRRRRAGRAALARSWPLGRAAPLGARRRRRSPYAFLPAEGEACTRFRSARCMPGSSSPAISASRQRRNGGAAGGAAGLRPQGRRVR